MRIHTAHLRFQPAAQASMIATAMLALGAIALSPSAFAVQCTVPGTHGSVQAAINDAGCDPIDLADATFAESVLIHRSMILNGVDGGATTLEGQLRISATASPVFLNDLSVRSGCPDSTMQVDDGAVVTSRNVGAAWSAAFPCPAFGPLDVIFSDGFEAG